MEGFKRKYFGKGAKDGGLRAYYYGFASTGSDVIDDVLGAVAAAGAGYHHTEEWTSTDVHEVCYADQIQDAANTAAKILADTRRAALQEVLGWAEELEASWNEAHRSDYQEASLSVAGALQEFLQAKLAECGKEGSK